MRTEQERDMVMLCGVGIAEDDLEETIQRTGFSELQDRFPQEAV